MGKKDLAEKKLEDYNDVFADIFNTLLFGEKELDLKGLKTGPTASIYKASGEEMKEQFRDTLKEYQDSERYVIAAYGIENQSGYDAFMPVRVMGYDYGSYRQQMTEKRLPLYPAVTIVLNFSETRWSQNKSIHEMLQVSEKQMRYIQDYRINVFDIAYLDDETIEKFQSDFKLVARFFKDRRLKIDSFEKNEMIVNHAEAFVELLSVFTGDRTYKEIIPNIRREKEEGKDVKMCWVVESYINRGIEQGIERGKMEEACLNAKMLFKNGASIELVSASISLLPAEKLREIQEEVYREKGDGIWK